jgi:hypothetical protein
VSTTRVKTTLQLVTILLLPTILSSCAVYSTGFTCPDSKGAKCVMLSEVDHMVDSGEIETVYMEKNCKGGKCKSTANVPSKALDKTHRVKLEQGVDIIDTYQDGEYHDSEYLYVR